MAGFHLVWYIGHERRKNRTNMWGDGGGGLGVDWIQDVYYWWKNAANELRGKQACLSASRPCYHVGIQFQGCVSRPQQLQEWQ